MANHFVWKIVEGALRSDDVMTGNYNTTRGSFLVWQVLNNGYQYSVSSPLIQHMMNAGVGAQFHRNPDANYFGRYCPGEYYIPLENATAFFENLIKFKNSEGTGSEALEINLSELALDLLKQGVFKEEDILRYKQEGHLDNFDHLLYLDSVKTSLDLLKRTLRQNKDYSYPLLAELDQAKNRHSAQQHPADQHNLFVQEISSILDKHDCSNNTVNYVLAALKDFFTVGMYGYWGKLNRTHERFTQYKGLFYPAQATDQQTPQGKIMKST